MSTIPIEMQRLNKAVDDATAALDSLYRILVSSHGGEVDYIPREVPRSAFEALKKVQRTVQEHPELLDSFLCRGSFKDVMERLAPKIESPEAQTALGSLAVELMGIFKNLRSIFHNKDSKRVHGADFDRLDQR